MKSFVYKVLCYICINAPNKSCACGKIKETKCTLNIDVWVSNDQGVDVNPDITRISIPLQTDQAESFTLFRLVQMLSIKTSTLFSEYEFLTRLILDRSIQVDDNKTIECNPQQLVWQPSLLRKRK